MKIALVIEQLAPQRGGVEQWTWQFARWLATRGLEVHVVARRFAADINHESILCHEVITGSGRLAFAEAAASVARSLRCDVVHDTGCGWHCDVFQPHGGSRQAAFERNLRLLPASLRLLKRGFSRWAPRYREFAALARRQYDPRDGRLFVALSRMVADDLQRDYDVPAEQLRIVYNGVDVQRFTPALRATHREPLRATWGVRHDEIVVMLVAHNFRLKGGPVLSAAVRRLRREGLPLRLIVIGGVKQRDRDGVSFLGSTREMAACYAAADLYVHPTFYDPCSLVVLEALASGLPVITTRYNGAGELMTQGVEGYILDEPDDLENLCAVLRRMVAPRCLEPMGRAARQLARAHDWQRNGGELLSVYGELAARRRAA